MRAQDWSRFLPDSSLSSLSFSLSGSWCSPVTLSRLSWYVCVPSGAAGRAKSQNPRTTAETRSPPLFSRGCSACECAVVSGAASTPAWPGACEVKSVSYCQPSLPLIYASIFAYFFYDTNVSYFSSICLLSQCINSTLYDRGFLQIQGLMFRVFSS